MSLEAGNNDALAKHVRAYYEAVDRSDLDGLLALFAPDARYERPGYAALVGRAALSDFYRNVRVIAEGRHAIEGLVVGGDEVAVRGSFAGRARAGNDLSVRFADFCRYRNGLIVERRTYFDAPAV